MFHNLLPLLGGNWRAGGADFDGTNDYMTRGALTGAVDSKTGILSAWIRLDGGDGTDMMIFDGIAGLLSGLQRTIGNKFLIEFQSPGSTGAAELSIITTSSYVASATWRHVLFSWDTAALASHCYVNDVNDKGAVTISNIALDYTDANWAIGTAQALDKRLNGCLAEFYFAPGQYLDFAVVANRRKFISAKGKPVHLGVNGALPTGTAPIIYLGVRKEEAVGNFSINRGTGGNFTITGTLDPASTSPSN